MCVWVLVYISGLLCTLHFKSVVRLKAAARCELQHIKSMVVWLGKNKINLLFEFFDLSVQVVAWSTKINLFHHPVDLCVGLIEN